MEKKYTLTLIGIKILHVLYKSMDFLRYFK